MAQLLYVEASPRKQRSASIFAASAFLDAYRRVKPADDIDVLDVWTTKLPEFDQAAFEAKYAGIEGRTRTPEQAAAWESFVALAQRFRQADTFLFGVPMWNFGIPYRLKHLIDAVSHKDLLFEFDERGLTGLMTNKKAVLFYARGISYDAASGTPPDVWDFQKRYMELWLASIGVSDIKSIVIEKTFFDLDRDGVAAEAARLAQQI